MPYFSKNSQRFIEAADPSDSDDPTPTDTLPSASRLTPGMTIIFRYYLGIGIGSREQKVVLIIGCKRGTNGVFPGKTGKLVSCLKLKEESLERSQLVLNFIVQNLYNRRRQAVYGYFKKHNAALTALLGKEELVYIKNSFRTYKLDKMKQIYRLNLI